MGGENWITVAGKTVGEKDSTFVAQHKTTGEIKKIHIPDWGDWQRFVYVRKCRLPEVVNGVALRDKSRDNLAVARVIAIGPGVGKRHKRNRIQKRVEWMTSGSVRGIDVYDMVLCPDRHGQIMASPVVHDGTEFYIHEDLIKCVIEETDDGRQTASRDRPERHETDPPRA